MHGHLCFYDVIFHGVFTTAEPVPALCAWTFKTMSETHFLLLPNLRYFVILKWEMRKYVERWRQAWCGLESSRFSWIGSPCLQGKCPIANNGGKLALPVSDLNHSFEITPLNTYIIPSNRRSIRLKRRKIHIWNPLTLHCWWDIRCGFQVNHWKQNLNLKKTMGATNKILEIGYIAKVI